jgi:hypothetical protein
VSINGRDECWPWTGAVFRSGYGQFTLNSRKHITASRYSFLIHGGILSSEQFALHTCDNPPCCNPRHLFAGTKKDNNMDRARKGRSNPQRGEDHFRALLNHDLVVQIRTLHSVGKTPSEISRAFSLDQSHVNKVIKRKLWAHV